MTDHDNELIVGFDQDGQPVKMTIIAEENLFDSELRRYWDDANTQSRHGKSNLRGHLAAQLVAMGRIAGRPWQDDTPPQDD